jgi:hypothetical protein
MTVVRLATIVRGGVVGSVGVAESTSGGGVARGQDHHLGPRVFVFWGWQGGGPRRADGK